MKKINIRVLHPLLLAITLILSALVMPVSEVEAAEFCSDQFYLNETLPNGSRWEMCWEHRQREGIILSAVFFTPKAGTRRMVLNQAAVAQIHVPYDDNGTRFHDLSDFGIGGQNLLDLNVDECPSGTLYPITYTFSGQSITKNGLCKQILKDDIGFKSGETTAQKYFLNLFNVSPVGAYYYIPTWRFMDDGTIEPWMGATGALQRYGAKDIHGWKMGDGRIGIAHLHNFYWKLDFDLNNTHLDDVVEEVNFALIDGKRTRQSTVFNTEAARQVNPNTMRHWRVSDKNTPNANGHNISYDIHLNEAGHQDIGPESEPFTFNDFYVTKQNNQEKFASHNSSGGRNLSEFVNGEAIENNDIVVWAGVTFYHMPRSEDAPHMDVHWSHLKIVPRDLSVKNFLHDSISINSAPTISSISNQTSETNQAVSIIVQASDVDGDALNYSANGLPDGLSINSTTGEISGRPNQIGSFNVEISVTDQHASSSALFTWLVIAGTVSENKGGGSISLMIMFLLSLMAVFTRHFRFKA